MDCIGARVLNQQLAAQEFARPEEVVAHFGAMQAQEYRMMRWAVAMRTKRPSARAFKEAFDSGRIVRIHLMRGTWQLVTGEDYWWMMDLFAGSAERIINGWMHSNGIDLPAGEIAKVREVLVETADVPGGVETADFARAVAQKGIVMSDQVLSYHIRKAELSGTLRSGELRPMKGTYSVVPGPRPAALDRDEALMRLARRYFQSHSPATFEDFVWWTGLGIGDCRRAVELLGGELEKVRFDGLDGSRYEGLMLTSCRTRGFRRGRTLLMAPYDEYLIGYKSRGVVLPENCRAQAHNNSGIFYPVVVRDGVVCGNWTPFGKSAGAVGFYGTVLDCEAEWKEYLQGGFGSCTDASHSRLCK